MSTWYTKLTACFTSFQNKINELYKEDTAKTVISAAQGYIQDLILLLASIYKKNTDEVEIDFNLAPLLENYSASELICFAEKLKNYHALIDKSFPDVGIRKIYREEFQGLDRPLLWLAQALMGGKEIPEVKLHTDSTLKNMTSAQNENNLSVDLSNIASQEEDESSQHHCTAELDALYADVAELSASSSTASKSEDEFKEPLDPFRLFDFPDIDQLPDAGKTAVNKNENAVSVDKLPTLSTQKALFFHYKNKQDKNKQATQSSLKGTDVKKAIDTFESPKEFLSLLGIPPFPLLGIPPIPFNELNKLKGLPKYPRYSDYKDLLTKVPTCYDTPSTTLLRFLMTHSVNYVTDSLQISHLKQNIAMTGGVRSIEKVYILYNNVEITSDSSDTKNISIHNAALKFITKINNALDSILYRDAYELTYQLKKQQDLRDSLAKPTAEQPKEETATHSLIFV